MGGGIGAMHYVGMYGMHVDAAMLYDPGLVALSVLVAVALAAASLYVHFLLPGHGVRFVRDWSRVLSATIMGSAVSGMHYTAMAAVVFLPSGSAGAHVHGSGGAQFAQIGPLVGVFAVLILGLLIVVTHESELRSHRARGAQLLSMSPSVFYTARAGDHAIGYVSENVERVLGWSPGDFTGDRAFWQRHIHPEDRERVLAELPRVLGEGKGQLEYRLRHRDGGWRWMLDERYVERDAGGAPRELAGFWRDVTRRREAEDGMRELNADLERRVAERTAGLEILARQSEHRAVESALRQDLGEMLQSCRNEAEAAQVLGRYLPRFFAEEAGALYVASGADRMRCGPTWGAHGGKVAETMALGDCWGLRRGRTYVGGLGAVRCAHCAPEATGMQGATVCVPLTAQGEPVGLLYLAAGASEAADEAARAQRVEQCTDLAEKIASQAALALSSLKLRDTLRDQSIRDPLTGLFNRRYLEESLERELARASRASRPLAVFMLDVDHFKKYNDRYGHDGGDAALRALGRLLKGACRASDLACRFGGEEFTVVLSDTDAAAATAWAERLMADVRALKVKSGEHALEGITISMGLALFLENGSEAETLLQAADLALYEAKHAGRDRLAVASRPDPRLKQAARGEVHP